MDVATNGADRALAPVDVAPSGVARPESSKGVGGATPFEDSGRATQPDASQSGFWAFATAGKKLAALHLDYEKLDEYPLKWIEAEDVPLSYRIDDKMRLSKDKITLKVNPSLTLAGIPPSNE